MSPESWPADVLLPESWLLELPLHESWLEDVELLLPSLAWVLSWLPVDECSDVSCAPEWWLLSCQPQAQLWLSHCMWPDVQPAGHPAFCQLAKTLQRACCLFQREDAGAQAVLSDDSC